MTNCLRATALILHYHRVADLESDPFRQAVTPEEFERHLEVITTFANPVSLNAFFAGFSEGHIAKRSVIVTFDDGYADNLHAAKPLLEKYGVPATIFVSTTAVLEGTEFYWDALERLFLGSLPLSGLALPQDPELASMTSFSKLGLSNYNNPTLYHGQFNALTDPVAKQRFFNDTYLQLRDLPGDDRSRLIQKLHQWVGTSEMPRFSHRVMTSEEVASLSGSDLIEIGGHCRSHPFLPALSLQDQRTEIEVGKAELEMMLENKIHAFAYPYGAFNDHSVALVQSCGYQMACTTQRTSVRAMADQFRLPRVLPGNRNAEELCEFLDASFKS
jgi:peptidoglycan/xylan/chitin deacetylase (PgdA/CDA1 family)